MKYLLFIFVDYLNDKITQIIEEHILTNTTAAPTYIILNATVLTYSFMSYNVEAGFNSFVIEPINKDIAGLAQP